MEFLRITNAEVNLCQDPAAWLAEKARRVEQEMIDSGEADPADFLKLKPPKDLTFIEEIRYTYAKQMMIPVH